MKLDRNRENKFDLSKVDENFLKQSLEFFETPEYRKYVGRKAILDYKPIDFIIGIFKKK